MRRTRCAYQVARIVSFLENFSNVLNEWSPVEDNEKEVIYFRINFPSNSTAEGATGTFANLKNRSEKIYFP